MAWHEGEGVSLMASDDQMERLHAITNRITALDAGAMARARARQDTLTKPGGSLGRLEELSIHLAGISGHDRPRFPRKAVIVLAADHGVAVEGVSAYPQAVTPQMVANFVAGGAAINVLARQVGARVAVGDLGVAVDIPASTGITHKKVGYGTRNMAAGPAMSRDEALTAILAGAEMLEAEMEAGLDIVATGDMGIGNTTAASAIVAAITQRPTEEVTGRGTGLTDEGVRHKVAIIKQALLVNHPAPDDPLDVLAKVGGFEIAGLAGVILAACARRIPVVIDGFISGAAALIATGICAAARDYLIAAHLSVEAGHRVILEHLRLTPLLNLNLRLGEGTGAALALPLIDAAAAILDEMATFAEAGVSEKE
jgi:nicotinate-nucleotide--dimethylbenzimidazole phosphoribosyltransferase